MPGGICLPRLPTGVVQDNHRLLDLPFCVTPLLITNNRGAGMLTGCPSPTSYDLGLGPALPWGKNSCPGNLRLSAEKILTSLYATYSDILTSDISTTPYGMASQTYGKLPYHCACAQSVASVPSLSPVTFSAHENIDQ